MEINLKGRKIKGFKFKNSKIGFRDEMNNFIGEVGEISSILYDRVRVQFKEDSWFYPLDQIEKHLIPEENEIPELGEGVLMEVSDYKDFYLSCERMVIGKHKSLFIVGDRSRINYWQYARQVRKVVLTHKQIAEKFDIDINKLEIEK
tara:strand:+ start:1718 stop:2158 length:441 start_codon:yes stop_codon:yes gene_type:complete